jgi:hypothetical protein
MANKNKNMCGSGLLMLIVSVLLVIVLFKMSSSPSEGYNKAPALKSINHQKYYERKLENDNLSDDRKAALNNKIDALKGKTPWKLIRKGNSE